MSRYTHVLKPRHVPKERTPARFLRRLTERNYMSKANQLAKIAEAAKTKEPTPTPSPQAANIKQALDQTARPWLP